MKRREFITLLGGAAPAGGLPVGRGTVRPSVIWLPVIRSAPKPDGGLGWQWAKPLRPACVVSRSQTPRRRSA
jgi:hypothetical protein